MNKFYNPVKVYFGKENITEFSSLLEESNFSRCLVIQWGENAFECEAGKEILKNLEEKIASRITISVSNPDIKDLFDLYTKVKDLDFDFAVGVGGGTILDLTKSICLCKSQEIDSVDDLRNCISEKKLKTPACPWIGIPTTAGTGSEVTCWATIWDNEKNSKLSVESPENYALAAFSISEFYSGMPEKLKVSSALDALCHAVEAYWSKNHNTISDNYAITAIQLIMKNLPEKNYEAMCQASLIAGLAFSNTKTTACHSISYPLTMKYKIPHGIAVSILLPVLLKENKKFIHDKKHLLNALGESSFRKAGKKIRKIMLQSGIGIKLSDYGAKEEDLQSIVSNCFTKGRMENNPKDLTADDVLGILKEIL